MKYALIADIHSNLEGFEVVLEDAQKNNCTHYVCLGDVVGYNPNPSECMKIVRDMGMPCIMGNHDEYCATDTDLSGFNPHAGHAIMWTRDQLSDEERDWLQRLKYLRMIANFTIVHATLDAPKRWGYVMSKLDAAASFTYQNTGVCFFGHTHVPVAITRRNFFCVYIRSPRNGTVVPMSPLNRQIFNCGSIGQPRDGDVRGAYLIYDTDRKVVEFYRFDYDFHRTKEKIFSSGLPEEFGRRLLNGL